MHSYLIAGTRISMVAVALSTSLVFIPTVLGAKPPEVARFEGNWGFEMSDPHDSWWGSGLRGGVAACGAPKQYKIDIREEVEPDGSRGLFLRIHSDQPYGALVTSISAFRLTAKFMNDVEIYELQKDGSLIITQGNTRLFFKRCEKSGKQDESR